jgi:hypothetical protein
VAPTVTQSAGAGTGGPRTLERLLGLEDAPVSVFGWIQNSYTATPGFEPGNGLTETVFPNRLANAWQGNQYYLVLENPVETGSESNLGFRFDTLLGDDWQFSRELGLFDAAFKPNGFLGVDFPQFFGEWYIPVTDRASLRLKGGRFYSPAGFESVMAVNRPLLSVSNILNYTPFTFFGALATVQLGERWTLFQGAVNGADRFINENYHYSYLGGWNWKSADERTVVTAALLVGPNQTPFFPTANTQLIPGLPVGAYTSETLQNKRNPWYLRSTLVYQSTVLTRTWGEHKRWTQAVEGALVTQGNVMGYGDGGGLGRITYYGGAHWLLFAFSPRITGVSRFTIFADPQGFVLPAPGTYRELTHGLILKPRPDFWIRPEIRWDWTNGVKVYDDATRTGQITLAVDVIFQF